MTKSKKALIESQEIPSIKNFTIESPVSAFPDMTKLEGFEQFRQAQLQEIIRTYDLYSSETEGLLKIPIKEIQKLLERLFQQTSEFFATHSNLELTCWLFQRYYDAMGIPFDLEVAHRVRENVLHLAHKLYEIHQRRAENDHA